MSERYAVYLSALVFLWSVAKQYRPSESLTRVLACWRQTARSKASRAKAKPHESG
jgi:hypothetical protein